MTDINEVRGLSVDEMDQASGGFFPFIATGIAIGILYCWADGDFDTPPPKPGPKGDFPTGPKNVG